MTSSYLGNKISDMKARFEAENEAIKNDSGASDSSPFGSRPGSVRRPKLLVDGSVTPTRTRKKFDLPGSNFPQPVNNGTDTLLLDQKMKEIMKMTGIITIDGVKYKSNIDDLELLGELGNGTCGHVVKMLHRPSQRVIAVKQMRRSGNAEENKRIAMDLEVVLMSHDCDYIVHCLGCFVTESDVWICMELMGSCFDKLIKRVVTHVPEPILGKVTLATVNALHYLKENHGVMHRDVKPSNILIDERGNVKLCDFGISGRLVDSKAKSMNAGCAAYMSPERINPADPKKPDYDIRADVWSLGITLVELATGEFPYPNCKSDFEVLSRVMQDDPPSLPDNGQFSLEFIDFIKMCLVKDYRQRPKYRKLLEHPFIKLYESEYVDVASWYTCAVANQLKQTSSKSKMESKDNKCFCGFNHENRSNNGNERSISCSSRRKPSQDWEKLKGVWNNILKSPLFNRRKKSSEKDTSKTLPKEEESFRPPVSPLLLQRFLHQQIQHMNAVRPVRSPSLSPKCDVDNKMDIFRYDEAWMDERDRRGSSVSPPVHPRCDQFGRYSSRTYRVSPSSNWLVRSKSMAEQSKNTMGHRSKVNDDEMITSFHRNMNEHCNLGVNKDFIRHNDEVISREVNRKPQGKYDNFRDDVESCKPIHCFNSRMNNQTDKKLSDRSNLQPEGYRAGTLLDQSRKPLNWITEDPNIKRQSTKRFGSRLNQQVGDNFNSRISERLNSSIDEMSTTTDLHTTDDVHDLRKKSLEDQLNQRIIDLLNIRLTEHPKHPDQIRMEDRFNRRPLSPGTSSSPEPPPRINKRVSPLLARRIAYNNSRLARLHQSPCFPLRFNPIQVNSMDQPEVLLNLRSTSLPCSPVLPTRNYPFDNFNYQHYLDYMP